MLLSWFKGPGRPPGTSFPPPGSLPGPGKYTGVLARLKLSARAGWPAGPLRRLLAPFARRVGWRYALETVRLALTWGLAAAATLLIFLHWTPLPAVKIAAVAGCLAAGSIGAWRWLLRPDALTIVKLADNLELGGAAVTAYRLLQAGTPGTWERAALAAGLAACAGFRGGEAGRYPVVPAWSSWRGIAILLVVFTGLALTPSPLRPYWEERRAEERALAAAAGAAEQLVKPLAGVNRGGRYLLPEDLRRRLADLDRAVREAGRREEAAKLLRQAAGELDQAAADLAPAGQEAARLAALWQEQAEKGWQQLAAALAGGDAGGTEKAAAELWSRLARLEAGSPEAREAAWSFWQAAEATGRPELRRALREAARALNGAGSREDQERQAGDRQVTSGQNTGVRNEEDPPGPGVGPGNEGRSGNNEEAAAGRALAAALADLAAAAGVGSQLLAAAAGLEQLGAGLSSGYPAAMLAAGGAGTAGGNMEGAGNSPGAVTGGSSGGSGTTGGGQAGQGGNGGQPGQGHSPGDGQGTAGGPGAGDDPAAENSPATGGNHPGASGQGAGAVTGGDGPGNGAGAGGEGSGRGNGSDAGGQGRGGGAGTGGGGLEQIYVPFLIGGEGPASQVHGTTRPGAAGGGVNLPGGPLVRGGVRPYSEAYPAYTALARENLSRASLPPALENLVWQYFSAIEPGKNGQP